MHGVLLRIVIDLLPCVPQAPQYAAMLSTGTGIVPMTHMLAGRLVACLLFLVACPGLIVICTLEL